ncbi:MAG: hypothetical protein AAE977_02925 [Thermoplasmataceae archaeon]
MIFVRGICEIDHIELICNLINDVISALRSQFPYDIMRIVAFSFNRLISLVPMKSL